MIGKKKLWVQILIIILLVLGTAWAGFPILWMLLNSFKPNSEIFAWPPTWIYEKLILDEYKAIFTNPEQVRYEQLCNIGNRCRGYAGNRHFGSLLFQPV